MFPSLDIDECGSDNGGCSQSCSDEHGSYHCSCVPGYVLDNTDHATCNGTVSLRN